MTYLLKTVTQNWHNIGIQYNKILVKYWHFLWEYFNEMPTLAIYWKYFKVYNIDVLLGIFSVSETKSKQTIVQKCIQFKANNF